MTLKGPVRVSPVCFALSLAALTLFLELCLIGAAPCAQGDLVAGEIVEQLLHASRIVPIRNVVFMGMGV